MSSLSERAGMTRLVSSTGVEDGDRLDGDPVVVRGRQRQTVALEPGEDPGEDRPGLVACRSERHLRQRLAEHLLGDPGRGALARRRDGRELLGVDALDVRLEAAGPDVQRVAGLELEVHPLGGRQRTDEVREELGRHGGRAVRVDLAGHPVGDPDLQVRGGELEAGVLGLEEDVRQDREGASGGDRPARDGQAAGEVLLHDRQLHG